MEGKKAAKLISSLAFSLEEVDSRNFLSGPILCPKTPGERDKRVTAYDLWQMLLLREKNQRKERQFQNLCVIQPSSYGLG